MATRPNTKELIRRAMSELGKRTSEKKAEAARENGKKGGRPPKKPPNPA
jgi:hypothetical protein